MTTVLWHDIECHAYAADLPLWHELAAAARGPILDVGAGTGRVTLDLAAAGFTVTALDRDPELIGVLRERAARRGLDVAAVVGDGESFDLGDARFALVVVPMQTIQLLGDRAGFFASVRAHLEPGGLVAVALSEGLEPYDGHPDALPEPDVGERDGWSYRSQPVAIRIDSHGAHIDRVRTITAPDGSVLRELDVVSLASVTAPELEAEAAALGLSAEPRREIPPTHAHVGSTVVMLRG